MTRNVPGSSSWGPLHFAVVLFIQPCLQFGFTGAEVGIGDTDLLEPEFCAPLFDLLR